MIETKTVRTIDATALKKRWTTVKIKAINDWVTQRISQPEFHNAPTFQTKQTLGMLADHPFAGELIEDILHLEHHHTLSSTYQRTPEPPTNAQFAAIEQTYVGADGHLRHPNIKFYPLHAYTALLELQDACNRFIQTYVEDNAWPTRPGIIIDSGYRSPSYQAIAFLRTLAERGLDDTLNRVALPRYSQHGDYKQPALDITIIGDKFGKRIHDSATHLPDSTATFERSVEFEALMHHGADFGFWLPFYPNPTNPQSGLSPSGIIYEPWHWQYVGTPNAKALMDEHGVYAAVEARKPVLV